MKETKTAHTVNVRKPEDIYRKCQSATCAVCMVTNKLDQSIITAHGFKHNECLTAMLELAPSVKECLKTRDIPENRKIQLSRAFEDI